MANRLSFAAAANKVLSLLETFQEVDDMYGVVGTPLGVDAKALFDELQPVPESPPLVERNRRFFAAIEPFLAKHVTPALLQQSPLPYHAVPLLKACVELRHFGATLPGPAECAVQAAVVEPPAGAPDPLRSVRTLANALHDHSGNQVAADFMQFDEAEVMAGLRSFDHNGTLVPQSASPSLRGSLDDVVDTPSNATQADVLRAVAAGVNVLVLGFAGTGKSASASLIVNGFRVHHADTKYPGEARPLIGGPADSSPTIASVMRRLAYTMDPAVGDTVARKFGLPFPQQQYWLPPELQAWRLTSQWDPAQRKCTPPPQPIASLVHPNRNPQRSQFDPRNPWKRFCPHEDVLFSLESTQMILIEEVCTLDPLTMDSINAMTCAIVHYMRVGPRAYDPMDVDYSLPFAGKRLFLTGGWDQAPPVISDKEPLAKFIDERYIGRHVFASDTFNGQQLLAARIADFNDAVRAGTVEDWTPEPHGVSELAQTAWPTLVLGKQHRHVAPGGAELSEKLKHVAASKVDPECRDYFRQMILKDPETGAPQYPNDQAIGRAIATGDLPYVMAYQNKRAEELTRAAVAHFPGTKYKVVPRFRSPPKPLAKLMDGLDGYAQKAKEARDLYFGTFGLFFENHFAVGMPVRFTYNDHAQAGRPRFSNGDRGRITRIECEQNGKTFDATPDSPGDPVEFTVGESAQLRITVRMDNTGEEQTFRPELLPLPSALPRDPRDPVPRTADGEPPSSGVEAMPFNGCACLNLYQIQGTTIYYPERLALVCDWHSVNRVNDGFRASTIGRVQSPEQFGLIGYAADDFVETLGMKRDPQRALALSYIAKGTSMWHKPFHPERLVPLGNVTEEERVAQFNHVFTPEGVAPAVGSLSEEQEEMLRSRVPTLIELVEWRLQAIGLRDRADFDLRRDRWSLRGTGRDGFDEPWASESVLNGDGTSPVLPRGPLSPGAQRRLATGVEVLGVDSELGLGEWLKLYPEIASARAETAELRVRALFALRDDQALHDQQPRALMGTLENVRKRLPGAAPAVDAG